MKKLMLITPMLHQGGFERVCVTTARLMQEYYDVTILIFSDKDINYDITGLNVININVPSKKSKLAKVINLIKRIVKTRKVKKSSESILATALVHLPIMLMSCQEDRRKFLQDFAVPQIWKLLIR